jgi:chemotaxis protein methyltransferase CheR
MSGSETKDGYWGEPGLNQSVTYIDSARNALFETSLTPIARAAGAVDLQNFVHKLRSNRPERLRSSAAEAMLINETSFFRDFVPFELLRRSIFPKMIERGRAEKKLRIWSAASSTGQEAYSLAIMLCEYFPELVDWDVKIVATDISQTSMEYAARGRYRRSEVNRGLSARMLLKYFVRERDEWRIDEGVRLMVNFLAADLRRPLPLLEKFDLVLLRNVVLYFSKADRDRVLTDVHRMMYSHGALLLGNAEQAEDSTDLFGVVLDADYSYYRPLQGSEPETLNSER